jgi:hypothetical protein
MTKHVLRWHMNHACRVYASYKGVKKGNFLPYLKPRLIYHVMKLILFTMSHP